MLRNIRNAFISGLALLLPLAVTIIVIEFLLTKVGEPASRFFFYYLEPATRNHPWFNTLLNILSTFVVVVLITTLGFLSRYVLGHYLMNLTETIIHKVPFINTVYKTVKQIVDTFSKEQRAIFRQVVLIEYPKKGSYALGFLTGTLKGEAQIKTSKTLVNVFVPTTPNPTSGFLLLIPQEDILHLDMSIGDGMKLIISGGAVVPPYDPEKKAVPISNPTQTSSTEE